MPRHGDELFAGQILPGQGCLGFENIRGLAFEDDLPTHPARSGAHVDDMVRAEDGFGVMLDDEHRIPLVPQVYESGEEALVVPLVKSDARLIEYV